MASATPDSRLPFQKALMSRLPLDAMRGSLSS